jgi:chemotaxis protein MotB
VKRKKEEEHDNLERWLITYSDLITLLLAFFIMMYTFSKQDAQKYEEVSEYLRAIFSGGTAVLKAGAAADSKVVLPMPKESTDIQEIAKQLEKEIQGMAEATDPEHKISVLSDERGIVIRIMDRAFFDNGRAELKDSAKNALMKIAPIIKASDNQIRIEGHTDNVPISTNEFKSNWELSVRRATEVVRHLIEKYEFPPERISASGYAEYRPVAPNDTEQDRALNRRIEIILLRQSNTEPLQMPQPGQQALQPGQQPPQQVPQTGLGTPVLQQQGQPASQGGQQAPFQSRPQAGLGPQVPQQTVSQAVQPGGQQAAPQSRPQAGPISAVRPSR